MIWAIINILIIAKNRKKDKLLVSSLVLKHDLPLDQRRRTFMNILTHIYVYVCVSVCNLSSNQRQINFIYIYIYIFTEVHICIYTYIDI